MEISYEVHQKKTNGKIVRVSDSEARTIVSDGKGKYIPKSEWKKERDKERE